MNDKPFIDNHHMSFSEAYKYYNNYDISKYVINLSYYQYTKKFKENQVGYVNKLFWIIISLTILFFALMIVQLVLCIVYLFPTNSLSAIGIALCSVWFLACIACVQVLHWNAKKYYKVIDFLMGQGSIDPVAMNYPRIVYTMLWYFHTKPMWSRQWYGVKGLVMQSWVGYNKSLGLFIDRLNQYYLDHQNDPSVPKDNNPLTANNFESSSLNNQ